MTNGRKNLKLQETGPVVFRERPRLLRVMKKSDIQKKLSREFGLTSSQSRKILDAVIDRMALMLCEEERLEVRNFGSFFTKSYKSYDGRNPRTGEPVRVGEKKLPHFRASRRLTMGLTKKRFGG